MRTLPTSDMRTLLASDMPRVDASVFFPDFDLSSIQVYVPMTCAQIVQTLTWRRYQPGAGVGVGVGVGCTVHGRAFYVAVWASTFAYCVVPGGLHAPEVARVPCAKSCAVCHLVDIDIKTKARAGSLSPAELPQPISTWSVLSPRHCDDLRLDKIANSCPMYPSHLPGERYSHPWSYRGVRCIALTCHGMAFAPMVGVRCIALTCHGGGLRTHGRSDLSYQPPSPRCEDIRQAHAHTHTEAHTHTDTQTHTHIRIRMQHRTRKWSVPPSVRFSVSVR